MPAACAADLREELLARVWGPAIRAASRQDAVLAELEALEAAGALTPPDEWAPSELVPDPRCGPPDGPDDDRDDDVRRRRLRRRDPQPRPGERAARHVHDRDLDPAPADVDAHGKRAGIRCRRIGGGLWRGLVGHRTQK